MSNWKELVSDAAMSVKDNESKISAFKEKIKSLQSCVSNLEKCNTDLKEEIIATLEDNGVDKLVYDGVTVTMGNAPWSVIITDQGNIPYPYQYEVTDWKIDKKALINNKDVIDIDGVEFVQTKKLTIKV